MTIFVRVIICFKIFLVAEFTFLSLFTFGIMFFILNIFSLEWVQFMEQSGPQERGEMREDVLYSSLRT